MFLAAAAGAVLLAGAAVDAGLPLDEPLSEAAQCNQKSIGELRWHDAAALGLRGRAFNDTAETYHRLPASAKAGAGPSGKGPVRAAIWGLQSQPAGLFVQFETDAGCIFVNYTIGSASTSMWHFPSTGVAGMDLYGWDAGNATWRWTGTSHPAYPQTVSKLAAITCPAAGCPPRAYRLHLPTYMATSSVSIGVSGGATIRPDSSQLGREKPIVWYGTSILQGGVASRPGQVNTHIVSRALSTEIYNFGFSGNGIMELNVAQYLTLLDASMIIVDCSWNMDHTAITARAVPLVKFLRANGHAATPIVLAEGTPSGVDWASANPNTTQQGANAIALAQAYHELIAAGDKHLYYVTAAQLFSDTLGMPAVNPDTIDPTVGGVHLSDLGMRKQAAFWSTAIPKFMAESRRAGSAVAPAADASTAPMTTEELEKVEAESEAIVARAAQDDELIVTSMAGATSSGAQMSAPIDGGSFVRGRPFPDAKRNNTFDRFPLSYAPTCPCHGGMPCGCGLRNAVWALSEMSTGEYLRFTTDAEEVAVSWVLRPACAEKWFAGCHLWHMPDSGTNAFDVYAYDERSKAWRHLANQLLHYAEHGTASIVRPTSALPGKQVTYLVYLPLRNAPQNMTLSLSPPAATICGGMADCGTADSAPKLAMPPILWYGTSIQQGGVASRAGTAYDAVISRALGREIFNIGFANNGVMELSVAAMLVDIKEAAAIVIDCLPNMNTAQVLNRTVPLVKYLRAHGHATTPIVLAEGTPTPADWLNSSVHGVWPDEKNAALRSQYEALLAGGEDASRLHYVSANELFRKSLTAGPEGLWANPTVGGIHSSDLGQFEIADWYVGYLPSVLQ